MAIQQAGEHAYGVQWSEWHSEQQYGDEHTQRRCIRVCQCREEPDEDSALRGRRSGVVCVAHRNGQNAPFLQ